MRKGGVQKLKKWWVQSSFAGGGRCEKKILGALRLQPLFKILNTPLTTLLFYAFLMLFDHEIDYIVCF